MLLVPSDVRASLAEVLPPEEFTVYGLSWNHAGAVTHEDSHPYELYVPYRTARTAPELVASLVRTKHSFSAALPPCADASLPVCRDVWKLAPGSSGRPYRQSAVDIVFGAAAAASPGFPLKANVLVYSEADAIAGNFDRPVSVELGVPVVFDRPAEASGS